ncbi:MAG: hypothetical protein ACLTXD_02575 [Clostridia bacterium]
MFKKQKIKSKSGITLVALVVTIVVLLILAGVSLNLVIGNDGIMKRAKVAQERYRQASENEQKDLDTVEDYMNKMTGEGSGTGTGTVVKVNVGESATGVATINGKAGNTNNPTIPKGYIPVNTETANWGGGSSTPVKNAVDHGLVIQDGSGNQWVWVPVENISKYCESVDSGVAISGSTVTTKKYTKTSIEIGTGTNKTTITRGLPSSDSSYREPALLSTKDDDDKAKKAGFLNANDMATKMVREYETMIKSIEKYGGFYIGRYELSGTVDNPTEKTGATITSKTWYELYNACKKIGSKSDGSDKEGIATRMIWGCQWDATCDFIATKGEQKSIKDSSTWGNYANYNTSNSYTEGTTGYVKDAGTKLDTGKSEYWKANNIYDIAGNCWEWTQEAVFTDSRAGRGGRYNYSGSIRPASNRGSGNPTGSAYDYIRFSSHFNNYYWNLERGNQWKEEWNRLTENRI